MRRQLHVALEFAEAERRYRELGLIYRGARFSELPVVDWAALIAGWAKHDWTGFRKQIMDEDELLELWRSLGKARDSYPESEDEAGDDENESDEPFARR